MIDHRPSSRTLTSAGPPLLRRAFGIESCVEPALFLKRIRARFPGSGASLFEGAELSSSGARTCYVITHPPVRLRAPVTLRAPEALRERRDGVEFLALQEGARDLALELAAEYRARAGSRARSTSRHASEDPERLDTPSILDAARLLQARARSLGSDGAELPAGLYGAFGFELIDHFEDLPRGKGFDERDPELDLVLGLSGAAYDRRAGRVSVVVRAADAGGRGACPLLFDELCRLLTAEVEEPERPALSPGTSLPDCDADRDAFLSSTRRVLEHVRSGDVFQCVLSRRVEVESDADPLEVHRRLAALNPSSFHFIYDTGDGLLLGASPEPAVLVRGRQVELHPIAGTRSRGRRADGTLDPARDERLAAELLADEKERAEHAMLVDLARNDLARISRVGSRRVSGPRVVRFHAVQHLVTRVRSELRLGLDALSALRACSNMGTVCGAPKLRAIELLRELEPRPRGYFGGSVGVLTAEGDLTTAITIRSLFFRGGRYRAQAGAGIVEASVPEREFEETVLKLAAPLEAVARASTYARCVS